MKVPIFNTLFFGSNFKFKTNNIDLNTLNNLNFEKVNLSRYPMVKILKLLPKKHSLFETVIVSVTIHLLTFF